MSHLCPNCQVIAPDNLDTSTMTFDRSKLVNSIGGPVHFGDKPTSLQLRILIDHSVVEVFTEHGQVLSTRVYCADIPAGATRGLYLVSFEGTASVSNIAAHELRPIWRRAEDVPEAWTVRAQ